MIYIINTINKCIRIKYPKITKANKKLRNEASMLKNSPEYKAL